ncbi:GH3 family domain-containing protein [Phaeodactylibacter xiamenensis]|uniref:GH3 family domain-containing protein n=1 Tax=Phaeodactylibacter xiamenensis TaxID=1524460 RepID=UPI0024A971B2|nr:GH3 auxin-responsive promoter family protein [Phaeodactylibacter xiamenensis]
MAILGSIVKSAITLKHNLSTDKEDPVKQQQEQLLKLLQTANTTAFGIYYGFSALSKADDPIAAYQQMVPIFDYDRMNKAWWAQQQQLPDITWPGKPEYFALSSGTTGKASKRIPVTEAMLDSIRSVGIAQAEHLAQFDLPPELFEKEILMLSSSAQLRQHPNGHMEGEISGINTNNIPAWFSGFYRPGLDIAQLDNWDERVRAIAEAAPDWDIGALAGIPSWIQLMLQEIIDYHKLDNIHDIWPSLSLYATGGVAFGPYRKSLEKLLARPLVYLDTYLASEGFFAYNARPGTMNMRLAAGHGIFYEFIPFDERGFDETGNLLDSPEVLTLEKVEEGVDYALLVSTPAGAYRYMIGDTIKFTDLDQLEIKISGRTKYFLNVVGSQLSEEKMNAAIQELSEDFGMPVNEFAVAAMKNEDGNFIHQWVIATPGDVDEAKAAERLDEALKTRNKNYAVARSKGLKSVELTALAESTIYDWLEQRKKKGGQMKMPRVLKAEQMQDLLDFSRKAVSV